MPLRALLVAMALVVAACTSDDTAATTATIAAATTSISTVAPGPSRQGMVPAPELILDAAAAHEITQLEADLYLTFAMFSVPEAVPFEYLAPVAEADPAQWDHSATTRLVERWDELDGEDRAELLNAVDGLDELLAPSGAQGIRATTGDSCIPVAGVEVLICVGASISQPQAPGLELDAAVAAVRPWVQEAVGDAWPKFKALLGAEPNLVKVFLSNLTATGAYIYGVVPPAPEVGACQVYVDVMIPGETDENMVYVGDPAIPDGVPRVGQLQATVAHELFHCFQREAGLPGFDAALWEGTATWAEHHVYPQTNTEARWMADWVSDPDKPFATRLYDTSFVFVYADLLGGRSSAVVDVLRSNSITGLGAGFEDLWHAISVSAWNQDPVDVLVNDDGALIAATVDDLAVVATVAEVEETLQFSLPLYSRDIQTFELTGGTSPQDRAGFARLWLDLSQVPSDVKISALIETADGRLDPVLLTGPQWQFCRMAIGPCNDADPAAILPYTRIVLVATNVDNGTETFSIPWNTFNPRLDGRWVRTDGPVLTKPGATAPYAIVGTEIGFDEPELVMTEDIGNFLLAPAATGWQCTFGGSYVITADPEYGLADGGNVSGTVTVFGPAEGEAFGNDCVLTSADGGESQASGLNIPVVAGPTQTFGFEIRDYDTVWIYAFERIYVYERIE